MNHKITFREDLISLLARHFIQKLIDMITYVHKSKQI